jgi:hypothetical protein
MLAVQDQLDPLFQGPVVRQNIMEEGCDRAKLLTSWRLRRRKKEAQDKTHPFQVMLQ